MTQFVYKSRIIVLLLKRDLFTAKVFRSVRSIKMIRYDLYKITRVTSIPCSQRDNTRGNRGV